MASFAPARAKRKRKGTRSRVSCAQPLPVPIASLTGVPPGGENWYHFSGRLVGGHVTVSDKEDMLTLSDMVRLCACMCVYIYMCACVRVYECVFAYMCVCVSACMHSCIHNYVFVHMSIKLCV